MVDVVDMATAEIAAFNTTGSGRMPQKAASRLEEPPEMRNLRRGHSAGTPQSRAGREIVY